MDPDHEKTTVMVGKPVKFLLALASTVILGLSGPAWICDQEFGSLLDMHMFRSRISASGNWGGGGLATRSTAQSSSTGCQRLGQR
jgi:hypothetical protein